MIRKGHNEVLLCQNFKLDIMLHQNFTLPYCATTFMRTVTELYSRENIYFKLPFPVLTQPYDGRHCYLATVEYWPLF